MLPHPFLGASATNRTGQTAMEVAFAHGHTGIAALLATAMPSEAGKRDEVPELGIPRGQRRRG